MSDMPNSVVPRAFRGNCDCGRWLVLQVTTNTERVCECGRIYHWKIMAKNVKAIQDLNGRPVVLIVEEN